MQKISKTGLVAATLTVVLSGGTWVGQAHASGPDDTVAVQGAQHERRPESPDRAIADSMRNDPAGFQDRVRIIESTPALVRFIEQTTGRASLRHEVEKLAAVTQTAQAEQVRKNLEGKTFLVTKGASAGVPDIKLLDNGAQVANAGEPIQGPECWQAWVAAYAWYLGTGAICGAVGVATFAAGGFVCEGVVFTADQLINWNSSC